MNRKNNNPLQNLIVIDCLEVGPAYIESNRITVPYSVIKNDTIDSFRLIYRYQEKVFEKEDPGTPNLANMIGVQVALNYGLFCKKIIFRGNFDDEDQRFIKSMSENTAREIYVKKFLEQNPFINGSFAKIPVIKQNSYLNAELLIPEKIGEKQKVQWRYNPDRHAILLSGGKESLLSYGLLKEIGMETHPVFINESGRHWFTALNSYRYFLTNEPHTFRIWTNSDRLFSWMLRHLPFVRQDFSRVRSDEYPIRLWTVAVFLFAAVPLLKKRGIGRLTIGDEIDTTRYLTFEGISHYDGLYDQSRYFDSASTRYFRKKGWNIDQFSILRPLSELLIEKILVRRYIELQKNQTSCHAAHIEGNRVRPCGRCEKCHRIIGMLVAIGADPSKCGYTDEQIVQCLNSLPQKEIHQEQSCIQHTLYLLAQMGILEKSKNAKPHPEIEKLRFHQVYSPIDTVPQSIRKPLFKILLAYAKGAVKKMGREWIDIDVLSESDPLISSSYKR